jgi:hypothetical protein
MAGGRQPNRCRASCIDTQNFDLPKLWPLRTFSGVAPLSGPAPAVGVSLNGFDKRRMTALQRSEQRVSEAGRIAKGSTNPPRLRASAAQKRFQPNRNRALEWAHSAAMKTAHKPRVRCIAQSYCLKVALRTSHIRSC